MFNSIGTLRGISSAVNAWNAPLPSLPYPLLKDIFLHVQIILLQTFTLFLFTEGSCQYCHNLEGLLISYSLSGIKNNFSTICAYLKYAGKS